jgi:cytochrome c-type protein NapC
MSDDKTPGLFGRTWGWLRRPSAKWSVLALVMVGFFGGILFWGGFHTALEATNTIEFCTSCHEMRDNVYEEYKGTIHDSNRTGVRATCPDCHVPKDWAHKIVRKIQASNEVFHKLMGTIDTKEKFEAHRMELATHVWKVMKESNSRECRNCHSFAAMNSSKQSPRAQKNHAEAQQIGKTCIDCHKGIAHLLPREYNEDE